MRVRCDTQTQEDLKRLLRDAAEGLPVNGRAPTWEADRPKVLPAAEPVKNRGFVDYERCGYAALKRLGF